MYDPLNLIGIDPPTSELRNGEVSVGWQTKPLHILVQDFFLQQPTGPQLLSSNTIFGNTFSKHDTFNHGLSTYPPPNTPPLPEIDSLMISA